MAQHVSHLSERSLKWAEALLTVHDHEFEGSENKQCSLANPVGMNHNYIILVPCFPRRNPSACIFMSFCPMIRPDHR